jgi:hypothetical protein
MPDGRNIRSCLGAPRCQHLPSGGRSSDRPSSGNVQPVEAARERFDSDRDPVQALRSLYFQAQLDLDRASSLRSHIATGYGIAVTVIVACGLIAAAFAGAAFPITSGEAPRSLFPFLNFTLTVLAILFRRIPVRNQSVSQDDAEPH